MAKDDPTFISASRKAEYKRIHDAIISRSHGREHEKGVHEKHHILPRSLGGSNDKSNIVCLTYREHFLVHWLLTKFTEGFDRRKMLHALARMTAKGKNSSEKTTPSWKYEISSKARSFAMTGGTGPFKGGSHSQETIQKIKQKLKGRRCTPEQIELRRVRAIGNEYGKMTKGKNMGKDNPKSKVVKCLNDGRIFFGRNEAARFYNICAINIGAVCLGKVKTAKGLRFEYV